MDLRIAPIGVEPDLGKPLHFAAALPVVEEGRILLHDIGVDGSNAVGLTQFERLANLGVGVVAAHEGGDVVEVARVGVTADEVAAHNQAAELLVSHLAHRQGLLGRLGGRDGGRGGSLGGGQV